MKYTLISKKNRPKYFDKLPPEIQEARKTIEVRNELRDVQIVHQQCQQTFREIQEDKIRLNNN